MSVNTSEEYLDELLHAIEPIIYANEPKPEPVVEVVQEAAPVVEEAVSLDGLMSDDMISLESLVAEAAGETAGETATVDTSGVGADLEPADVSMDDLLAALTAEENANAEEPDVDAMINAAVGLAAGADTVDAHDSDVKELLKQFSEDEDLSDIGEILERDENSEAVDESVLLTPDVDVFQLEETPEEDEETEPAKEKKGLFGFLKKKKKKKGQEEEQSEAVEVTETVELGDEATVDLLTPDDTLSTETDVLPDMENTAEVDALDLGSLMNLGDTEMAGVDAGLDLGNLFGDGDMADIDQLLAAGSFEEISEEELIREKGSSKASGEKEAPKGFFGKLLYMLFEEDEEDEEPKKKGNVPEADATGVTDENLGILDELSKEDKKKAKKEKKEQKKKEKEAKKKGKDAPEGEGNQEGEDGAEDEKKKKKKIKKEKPRKVVDIDQKPEKKLSRKKVSVVFMFCFSLLAVILLFKNVVLDLSNLKEARWAFDNADYETCYLNLYGEELSEEDELIFQKSYIILCVQRKLDSYENFIRLDMGVEALNALFDGVRVYRDMEERAGELGILDRISEIYQTIYAKLGEYGLSNEEIEEILDYESKVTYTKRLDSIVNGTPFDVEEISVAEPVEEAKPQPKPLEDVLPQEQDFLPEDTSSVNSVESVAAQEKSQTTVVGSAPVNVEGTSGNNNSNVGVNVGSGDTNVSATVNGDNTVVF